MIVEVWGMDEDEPKLDLTIELGEDGELIWKGNPDVIPFVQGIEVPGPGRRFTFEDGEPWLKLLPSVLSGTTQWAKFQT